MPEKLFILAFLDTITGEIVTENFKKTNHHFLVKLQDYVTRDKGCRGKIKIEVEIKIRKYMNTIIILKDSTSKLTPVHIFFS